MRQPVLFVGHGSPMNAIEDNAFRREWQRLGTLLTRPRAILVVSAHWETPDVAVTAMARPRTIHDFGGFPPALHAAQYPAPGDPALAARVAELLAPALADEHFPQVRMDQDWGLDHGAWSVLLPMFPAADIPVVQLSLARHRDGPWHYQLARHLAPLRDEGVLIVASGDMVHNLRLLRWPLDRAEPWALQAQQRFNRLIAEGAHGALQHYETLGAEAQLAIPTPEHYLPLLYALALQTDDDEIRTFNDDVLGSLSMTSLIIGTQPAAA